MDKKMTLGGFEAVLDSFIPNPDGGFRNSNVDENVNVNADEFESLDDEELEDIKNNNIEVKNKKEKPVEEQDTEKKKSKKKILKINQNVSLVDLVKKKPLRKKQKRKKRLKITMRKMLLLTSLMLWLKNSIGNLKKVKTNQRMQMS